MSETINTNNQNICHASAFAQERTYSHINNNIFYSFVGGTPYSNYYYRIIRPSFQWYDGYYPPLHVATNGIFSTRLIKSILEKLASQINGGTAMFDYKGTFKGRDNVQGKDAKKFVQDWATENNFSNQIGTAIEWSLAGGDSLLKLNYDGSDLWMSKHRKDTYLVDTDFRGKIISMQNLVHSYTRTTTGQERSKYHFYLLEERKYNDKGLPVARYVMKRGVGQHTNSRGADMDMTPAQTIDFKSLPRSVRNDFKKDFNSVTLGEEIELPFTKDLGVYLMKASESVTNLPDLPFGEGLISKVFSYLISYDYYYSAFNTDMYLARGRVLIPKNMQNPMHQQYSGYNSGLDSGLFTKIDSLDPEKQSPTPIQFELRADQWKVTRNNLLESIATALNVSVRTIAEYLNDSTNTTAREVSQEEDATILFVENKRSLYKNAIDKMLSTVTEIYGFSKNEVVIRFSKAGLTNVSNLVTQVATLKQNFLIDDKTALEWIFVDKDDDQIEEIMKKIEEQKEKERQVQIQQEVKSQEVQNKEQNNTDINHVKKTKEK